MRHSFCASREQCQLLINTIAGKEKIKPLIPVESVTAESIGCCVENYGFTLLSTRMLVEAKTLFGSLPK